MTVNVVYRRQAKYYRPGRIKPIRLLVAHDPEYPVAPGFAKTLGDYFATIDRPASAHAGAGPDGVGRYVADGDTAFGAPNANADGLHQEIAGFSSFTRAQWLEPARGLPTLGNAADQFAEWCALHHIPPVLLTEAQVADGVTKGITDHRTITAAFNTVGGHTDPGPNFPWDVLIDMIQTRLGETDMPLDPNDPVVKGLNGKLDRLLADAPTLHADIRHGTDQEKADSEVLLAAIHASSGGQPVQVGKYVVTVTPAP